MKVDVVDVPESSAWSPVVVKIRIDTRGEAVTFRHLIGCWEGQESCDRTEDVKEMAKEIVRTLIDNGFETY